MRRTLSFSVEAVRLLGAPGDRRRASERNHLMPQYAALIYTTDSDWSAPEHADTTAEYAEFGAAAASIIRGGAALYPTSTATTVHVTGGKGGDVVTTDGPFAETKDVLAGFYLLECDDLDQAVAAAAKTPSAWLGAQVEVRPALPMG